MTKTERERLQEIACDICHQPYACANEDELAKACEECPISAEMYEMEEDQPEDELGKKVDEIKKALVKLFYPVVAEAFEQVEKLMEELPTADVVEVVRCKDCKHFEEDHFVTVNGVPLIGAHNVCMFWGNGCITKIDGFCYAGEVDG